MGNNQLAVALPAAPHTGVLTYAVPERLAARALPGVRVLVPLRNQRAVGLVLGPPEVPYTGASLIEDVLDDAPIVSESQLALLEFTASYYRASLSESARLVMPPLSEAVVEGRYAITEAGKVARVFGAAHQLQKRDREALAQFEPGVLKTERQLRRSGVTKLRLSRLLERGLVEEREAKAIGRARTIEIFEWQDGGGPISERATAVLEMDEWLRDEGEVTWPELRAHFKGARAKINKLIELGRVRAREVSRSPGILPALKGGEVHALNPAQKRAVYEVMKGDQRAFLLEGVTGSGKTEVYLEVLRQTLDAGKGALFLVPEIALTPQLFARVQKRLGVEVALLHSGLSAADRRDAWSRLQLGHARVALGARSAVFAPINDLGLIVVDEEHEGSFKQSDMAPRYHARDLALWRAQYEDAIVILGSATPSLETRENVAREKLAHLTLDERVQGRPMPEVTVVDLRARKQIPAARKKDKPLVEGTPDVILSGPLKEALEDTVARGDQALLFLNRRGWSSVTLCESCGEIFHCPNCSVALTLHRRGTREALQCHQCGYRTSWNNTCPTCGEETLDSLGLGTERLEAEVRANFPHLEVARLDRDVARSNRVVTETLRRVQAGEVDVVVGTQMLAKGHDFPRISLVGIVLADIALGLPDFRASERAFQLLTQVAGRAGRGSRSGRVFLQTFNPNHPAVRFAISHDARGFSEVERAARRGAGYPPFSRLCLVRIEGPDENAVRAIAEVVARRLRDLDASATLGPAPAPIERIRNRARYQVLINTPSLKQRADLCLALEQDAGLARDLSRSKTRLFLDLDPINML